MGEINITDIKPNSHKYKNESKEKKKKVSPVVNKNVVITKKKSNNWFKKVVEFFADEEIEDGKVKEYIFEEWIEPGIKDILWDVAATLLGDGGRSRSGRKKRRDYTKHYRTSLDKGRRSSSRKSRERRSNRYESDSSEIDYRDIVVENRRDAEKIVDALKDRIEEYGEVTVAELLELCNIAGEFTDNDWGWTRSSEIGIRRVPDGFLIDVSEARYLND